MVGFHVDSISSEESIGVGQLQIQKSRKTSKNYNIKLDLSDYNSSKDPIPSTKKYKSYQCGKCRKYFNQKNYYQIHLRSHGDNVSPYSCNICGKSFTVPARLTRHFRTHTGEKPYQCEYCSKSFSVKENLSVHRRIHTKERPYKCNVCESAFEHSGKLHRHMRIHTGERPHKCSVCNKTFIQSGQLVIHMRTHTGEKPYICKSCGKGFTCSKQLKVHTRTHTGEKPYKCEICDKSFGYNHVLKLHQVAHYGEKFYKCTICNETFNSKKSMEFHIKIHSDSSINYTKSSEIIFDKTENVAKFQDKCIFENSNEVTNSSKLVKNNVDTIVYEYPKSLVYLNYNSEIEVNRAEESSKNISFSPNKSKIQVCHSIKHEISTHQNFFTDIYSNKGCTDKIREKETHKQYALRNDLQQKINRNIKDLEVPNEKSFKIEHGYTNSKLHQNITSSKIANETLQSNSDMKDNVCLPPRKRCKMILESMEIEKSNLTINERLNSVIRFARVEKI